MLSDDKYIVVEQYDIAMLEKEVNDYIKKGYEPIGGIAIYIDDDSSKLLKDNLFYQAMYKKD